MALTRKTVADFPEVAVQWHPTKNGDVLPDQITAGSNTHRWWKCPVSDDHEWKVSPNSRTAKGITGCPFCTGKRLSITNSLAAKFPDLALQWDVEKNDGLTAEQVLGGTNQKFWWKCPEGPDHRWRVSCNNRSSGKGCPFCSNQRVSVTNCLATVHPEIAAQWHPDKNGELTPDDVITGSNQAFWWKCPEADDHEWKAVVASRTGKAKAGCPCCAGHKASVTNSLTLHFPDVAAQWHPDKNGELTPDDVPGRSGKKHWWKCPVADDHEWEAVVDSRTGKAKAGCPCCFGRKVSVTNSLAVHYPEVAAQWHPKQNGELTPDDVPGGSKKRVWWKCSEGPDHAWHSTVANRTTLDRGCPFCANQKVSVTNSLGVLFPDIAAEWHPTKNKDLKPENVVAGSHENRWWKCPKGPDHEWETAPGNRTGSRSTGCPFCTNQQVSATNCLATVSPKVAAQWHPTKNKRVTPDQVINGSEVKRWWKCPKGPDHEWQTTPGNRTGVNESGCPCCAGQKVSVTNSLAKLFPDVAAQWHPTKNGNKTPDKVVAGTNKKYWWKCPNGPDHAWRTACSHRTHSETGCPCCAGTLPSVTNSLTTLFPDVALQWHPTKNGKKTPDEIVAGSNTKYWWKCPNGHDHEWKEQVIKRTVRGFGCPCCSGRKLSVTNNLAAKFPELARQWHPELNGDLTPEQIVAGSGKRIWWKCPKGPDHEWKTTCAIRQTNGCPCCSGHKLSVTNSLVAKSPELVRQWHPELNGDLTPEQVVAGSGTKVWWKCPEGPDHEWKEKAGVRSSGNKRGCPFCAGRRVSVTNSLAMRFPKVAAQWHPTKNGNATPEQIVYGTDRKFWWQCLNNPTHEWPSSPNSRTAGGQIRGCPYCTIIPRSKIEIYITFELLQFLEIDVDNHKLKLGRHVRDIDILIPELNLAIEFDGSYWHREKQEQDEEKTAMLVKAGWRVIRIRERPLKKIASNDIVVAKNVSSGSVKPVVDQLLTQIEKVCQITIPNKARYLRRKTLANKKAADAHIEKLLAERAPDE